jgi:bifunctional non-homologous end joining protein LigD
MSEALNTTLFFTEGSSDKVYSAQLEAKGDGWIVNFQYGRRGSSLTAGSKTPDPVEYGKALKIYQKLVSEKTSKGYSPDAEGVRYQGTENAGRSTGISPQLLNPIDESEIDALLRHDSFVAQPKHDGERRLIIVDRGSVTGTNRNGLIVPISQRLEASVLASIPSAVANGPGRTVLDGEDLGDAGFIAFDLLELSGADIRSRAYFHRLASLENLLKAADGFVQHTVTARSESEKRALLKRLRESNAEGIVFKDVASSSQPGRPNSGGTALKFKFTASATVVAFPGRDGKRSVEMRVLDADGVSLVPVGNVTIPANAAIPAEGELIEVEYLYAYAAGALFQPVYRRRRADLDAPDSRESLKLKAA